MPSTRSPRRFSLAEIKRRKAVLIVAAWGLLIAVLALFTPSVTVREQTHPAQALPALDAAVGDAAGLLAGKPYGYSLTALTSEGECAITPVRGGREYSRTVTVYPGKKQAPEVTEELYKALKDRYALEPVSFAATLSFAGTSADYVDFELRHESETVVWRATTGCRPAGDAVGELAPAHTPPAQSVAFMRKLGVDDPAWGAATAECGDLAGPGGTARTVTGTGTLPKGAEADVSALADDAPEDVKVVVDAKKLVSYRVDGVTYAVGLDGRTVTATATEGCDG